MALTVYFGSQANKQPAEYHACAKWKLSVGPGAPVGRGTLVIPGESGEKILSTLSVR